MTRLAITEDLIAAPFVLKRQKLLPAVLGTFVSYIDKQAHQADKAAAWLADCLPPDCVYTILGGARGLLQVPDPEARRAALISLIRRKGGPDGSSLVKARRALRELMAFRPDGCLPASSVLINRLLAHFDEADTNLKRTQGMTVRSDLIILKDLGLPTL